MAHEHPTDELLEEVALYALDLLEPELASAFERHVREGCAVCKSELETFRGAAGLVGLTAPTCKPPERLRERVMAYTRPAGAAAPGASQVWKNWMPEGGLDLHVVRAGEGDWQTVREGVHAKRLYVDTERDSVTMLVRMEPGSRYVSHRHAGPEQCFVLEGDLREGSHVFRAGDFQCAAPGTVHNPQWTEEGCLLLIVSSLRDELLA
jgi:anti-sigma factor ChrR (cupin superfamily)